MKASQASVTFERRLKKLQSSMVPLQRVVTLLAALIPPPEMFRFRDGTLAYRYNNPGLSHFCLLKAVRAISAFNSCLHLARGGFTQEIAVIIRTMVECTRQIDFALSGIFTDGKQTADAEEFVSNYFVDDLRGVGEMEKKPALRQDKIHKAIVKETERMIGASDGFDAEGAMRRTYRAQSNYVHARYPELMDMYGGTPGRFHCAGIRGTPKDRENIEILETYYETLALSIAYIVHALGLKPHVASDQVANAWFEERRLRAAAAG